jgi:uncharacterized protein
LSFEQALIRLSVLYPLLFLTELPLCHIIVRMREKRPSRASHALQFNVAQLLKQPSGACRVYDIDAEMPPLDDALHVVAPFHGQVRFTRVGAGLLVTGELNTVIELECTRCLSSFRAPVSFEIEEEFHPTLDVVTGVRLPQEPDQDPATLIDEHHILDLAEVVRQDLLLSRPSSVCRPDCRGFCPQCGQNWNEGTCNCQEKPFDPRWAALKENLIRDA